MPEGSESPRETRSIAIFPLENVVLLPRVRVPLHIFEPRYRQMVREVLEGDGEHVIGMTVVRPSETGAMQGNPDVFPIGCQGTIERFEALPQGRFNVVLAGTTRFRIDSESPPEGDRLYRIAHVVPIADANPASDRERVSALRSEVFELMRMLLRVIAPSRVEAFEQQPFAELDDEQFVNSFAQSIDFAPAEKQGLLEADRIAERYEKLVGLLRFRLAELTSGGQPGPSVMQ